MLEVEELSVRSVGVALTLTWLRATHPESVRPVGTCMYKDSPGESRAFRTRRYISGGKFPPGIGPGWSLGSVAWR